MNKMDLYNISPVFMQNMACSLEGKRLSNLRYGNEFSTYLEGYNSNLMLSQSDVDRIRNNKLKKMIGFCYEHVEYYKQLFDEAGVNPNSIRDERDISWMPILTKDIVRDNIHSLIPDNIDSIPHIMEHTSGSTGSSLKFPQAISNVRSQWAVFWRFWNSHNIPFGTLYADFGSRTIVPASQKNPPFYRICKPLFQVKFSAFHGNDENYYSYFKTINKYKLEWIHGYPSCIVPFASFVVKEGLKFDHTIRCVTTSAENLYDFQKLIIQEAFGVSPYSLYSLTEATSCMSEDENHNMLVDEDYSLVEFIPLGSSDIYHIVGSNLENYAFPLLRYDTGDLATYYGRRINGRRVVENIDGRTGELLSLPDGGKIGAFSALFNEATSIKEAQIHQKSDYSVEILFVPRNDEYEKDIEVAKEKFYQRTRGLLECSFKKVLSIPRTPRGKLRYVVSDVK